MTNINIATSQEGWTIIDENINSTELKLKLEFINNNINNNINEKYIKFNSTILKLIDKIITENDELKNKCKIQHDELLDLKKDVKTINDKMDSILSTLNVINNEIIEKNERKVNREIRKYNISSKNRMPIGFVPSITHDVSSHKNNF
jgi:hypothetical protein